MNERIETLVVLFADISGSTRLIQAHGDRVARGFVERCLGRVATVVEAHGGRVAGRIGDELMCLFARASDGVAAGLGIQDAVLAGGVAGDYPASVKMHIGLHMGPVMIEGDQIFGDTIHVAKRMVDLAKSDQILTTPSVMDAARGMCGLIWRPVDQVRIKGYERPIDIHEVMRDKVSATLVSSVQFLSPGAEDYARCRLTHSDRTCFIDADHPFFSIGRESGCDLVLPYACVSRDHGRLEYQKGRIIFVDHSTNGTLVQEQSAAEPVLVHREQRWLRGEGWLRFGSREDASGEVTLSYCCEGAEGPIPL